MEVIATSKGYHGKLREIGDKFEVPNGSKASWFAPVEEKGKAKGKSKSDAKPEGGDKPADPLV